MIKFFRKYRKTVFGTVIVLGGVLLMTSFGISNDFQAQRNSAAIKVDDVEISHEKFYEEQQMVERQFRAQFGKNYDQFAKMLNLNLPQQTVDKLITQTVLGKAASELGLQPGEVELMETVKRDFPQGYDENALKYAGLTGTEYLHQIEQDAVRMQLLGVVSDAGTLSQRELDAIYRARETEFTAQYVEFLPSEIEKEIPNPSDEEVKVQYEVTKSSYEIPPRVRYEYAVFSPDMYLDQIEIASDEVELYYTDNENQFKTPEQLKLRQIQILYPKSQDAKELTRAREKAQQALEKAKKGDSFEDLVRKYSDDTATALKGGDLGWVSRGKYSKAFDDKSYAVKDGGISDLIESDTGFQIVKVEGYNPSGTKPLPEVKDEIINKLRKEQAPAYADTKAREFFDQFLETDKSLSDFAKEKKVTVAVTNGLLAEASDPDATLSGLTKKVMDGTGDAKQVIDLRDKTIVVSLLDQKDTEIPSLETVKDKVVKGIKESKAKEEAQKRADDLLTALKNDPSKRLEVVAQSKKIALKKAEGVKEAKPGPFRDPKLLQAVVQTKTAFSIPEAVYPLDVGFVVFQVTSIKRPEKSGDKNAIDTLKTAQRKQKGDDLAQALIANLRAQAKIETDSSILHTVE